MSQAHQKSEVVQPAKSSLPTQVEQEILRAISGLAFGSVEIVIHDSKVVQIERKEKVRFH